MATDPNKAAEALLQNSEFMQLFQRALAGGGEAEEALRNMPKEGDPGREKWLKDLQAKLQAESMKEAQKNLEQVHSDENGQWMFILPKPGFCIKCFVAGGGKVFINVAQHERIDEPVPMAEEGAPADEMRYRVPLSCGAARPDKDKSGKPCKVYDVVVNPSTVAKCAKDNEFRRFVAALCMQWIQQKSEPTLNVDEFRNLNFKVKGTLEPQRIRLSHKPKEANALGDEIKLPGTPGGPTAPSRPGGARGTGPLIQEVEPTKDASGSAEDTAAAPSPPPGAAPSPSSSVLRVEKEGAYDWSAHKKPSLNPFFRDTVPAAYVVELLIPNISSVADIEVRLGNKRLECFFVDAEADSSDSFLTVVFEYPVSPDPTYAKYVKRTSVLKLRVPVALPDETAAGAGPTAAARDAAEEEEEERRAAAAEAEAKWAAEQERQRRLREEEEAVLKERREYVDNMSAVQAGEVPPALRAEIDGMPKEELPAMLARLEGRVRRGDSLDTLMTTLPETVLDSFTNYIREKLSLAPLKRSGPATEKKQKKKVTFGETTAMEDKDAENENGGGGVAEGEDTENFAEYNYAKKSEKLFGVAFHNRYLFALDD